MERERRRATRQQLILRVIVVDGVSGAVVGDLIDLSLHGLLVIGERPTHPLLRYRAFELCLPLPIAGQDHFDIDARPVRVERELPRGLYAFGLAGLRTDAAGRAAVRTLLARYTMPRVSTEAPERDSRRPDS